MLSSPGRSINIWGILLNFAFALEKSMCAPALIDLNTMKNKITALLLAMMASVLPAFSEVESSGQLLNLDVQARMDYQYDITDGHKVNPETGFKGKYLVLKLDGEIIKGLTYSWRQRLNKLHDDQNFFDATDWVYLNYIIGRWHFQAGKEVVAIGGYEYDRAPIDLYSCSVFWNNIPCYDLGVSAGFDLTSRDRLTFQAVQSPFFNSEYLPKKNPDMYAYNLMCNGRHGCFEAIYSANLIEYAKGKYINYLALGNKFSFGKVWLELDFMNRAASGQTFFFKDCSVMGELSWSPNTHWRIFGKATYDVNKSGTAADYTVLNGTELAMAGAGVEYFPLRKDNHTLRIHANAFYSWGHNANENDIMQHNTMFASVGLTWHMNLFNLKRRK